MIFYKIVYEIRPNTLNCTKIKLIQKWYFRNLFKISYKFRKVLKIYDSYRVNGGILYKNTFIQNPYYRNFFNISYKYKSRYLV